MNEENYKIYFLKSFHLPFTEYGNILHKSSHKMILIHFLDNRFSNQHHGINSSNEFSEINSSAGGICIPLHHGVKNNFIPIMIQILFLFMNSSYRKYLLYARDARAPTPGIWLLGGWLAEWLMRARVCSVYVRLCEWQAGWLACSFESACLRTLQMSLY